MRVQEKGVRKKVPIPMNMHFFDLKVALFWTLCNKTEKRNCAYLTNDENEEKSICNTFSSIYDRINGSGSSIRTGSRR